jgi:serine/threonine protein phosphatase PrpC
MRKGPTITPEVRQFMQSYSHLPNGRVAAYHDNSCHGEDAYVTRELDQYSALDAVLDGATGRGGADASAFAADMLRGAPVETLDEITNLLDIANKRLFQRGRGRFFLTTASVALKIGPSLHIVSIGDSSAFLIRGRDIVPLTYTTIGPAILDVSNGLGRRETLSYRTTCITLRVEDWLVLATDGLIENVAPGELVDLLDSVPSPEEAVSALQQLLSEKKQANRGRVDDRSGFRHDDATAIIRYIGLDPLQEAPGSPHNSQVV